MLAPINETTGRHNSEDHNLNTHHGQNITSHKPFNCAAIDKRWTQNDMRISSKIMVVICFEDETHTRNNNQKTRFELEILNASRLHVLIC